jgi:hypothetical protein
MSNLNDHNFAARRQILSKIGSLDSEVNFSFVVKFSIFFGKRGLSYGKLKSQKQQNTFVQHGGSQMVPEE